MRDSELHEGSYGGAVFFLRSSQTSGGRKGVLKTYPNSDMQSVEDMGKLPRSFSIEAIISATYDAKGNELRSYKEVRDALLAALEKGGAQRLVHPFYDPADNIHALPYSLSEAYSSLGVSKISLSFAIANTDGVPQVVEEVLSAVDTANDAASAAAEASIGEDFDVTAAFVGNFNDAKDKVTKVVTTVQQAIKGVTAIADEIDAFSQQISEFATGVAELVTDPLQLATSVTGLYATMKGTFSTATGTLEAYKGMFAYGDDDVSFVATTAGRTERQKNRDTLNSAMQSLALSHAYLSAVQIAYETEPEIEEVEADLEVQYQKMLAASGTDADTLSALAETRTRTERFLEAKKLTVKRVITVSTPRTSATALAYKYYGSADLANTIAELNGWDDLAFVEGDVLMFTP